jgi:hypothetical protein
MVTMYALADPLQAYLFECDDEALFAVSLDAEGSNIPRRSCPQGWRRISEFALNAPDPITAGIPVQTLMQGLLSVGYYIWREGRKPQHRLMSTDT